MNDASPRRALSRTLATLETETRTAEERRQWLAGKSARHPAFVAEVQGEVVAW